MGFYVEVKSFFQPIQSPHVQEDMFQHWLPFLEDLNTHLQVEARPPGANFMSQKLGGIPPEGILLLTLIATFPLLFFLGVNSAQLQSNCFLKT